MSDRRGKTYILIGRDGKPYASSMPGALGGHRRNTIYGRLDCAGARRWIARGYYVKHRVYFADEETAIAAGYRPCARCMPEAYAAWKSIQQTGRRPSTNARDSGEQSSDPRSVRS